MNKKEKEREEEEKNKEEGDKNGEFNPFSPCKLFFVMARCNQFFDE